jgi:type IX secretion system PorP/SprF family membrane protein
MCFRGPLLTTLSAAFLLLLSTAKAQYRMPIYTDYLTDNYYVLHPAMAGAQYEGLKIRSSFRTQWLDVSNAPALQSLNVHARVGDRSGIGGLFYHDKNGFQSQIGFQGTYAHHINFYRSTAELNQLSFGLTVGGSFHRHDQSSFDLSSGDPLISGTENRTSSVYADIGLTYNRLTLYAHLTLQNLVFEGKNISDDVFLDRPRRIIASIGNFFEIRPYWALEPSVMVDFVEHTNRPNIDVSLKSHHNINATQLWVGVSYRKGLTDTLTQKAIVNYKVSFAQLSSIIGFNYNKWMFSYTYTVGIGNIKINNFGFHQLSLGLDIFSDKYRTYNTRGIL